MREIGTLAQEKDARVLADYLLTRNITTKLEPKAGAWIIWVHREERLPEARSVLAEFEKNPANPLYQAAAGTAKEIRKKAEKVEKDYQKRVKNLRDRWEGSMYHRAPLAFGLMVASVIVTAPMLLRTGLGNMVFQALAFSVEAYDDARGFYDSGFAAIESGQVWRLITPIFLHFGPVHLIFNMIAMRFLGERVEMRKGAWRFALIALVAAVAGNVGQFFHSGGNFGGMSGVVFALAGYLWIKGHTDPEDGLSLDQRSVNLMLIWFVLGIIAPMNMANVAHGAGLVVGIVFGILRF